MKGDRLFFDGYFNETLLSVADFVAKYLNELIIIRPDVRMEVEVSNDGKNWRGIFLENVEWGADDVVYGYIEIANAYMKLDTPVHVKVFASDPKYTLWIFNLIILLEKHLQKHVGTPPPKLEPWEQIPNISNHQEILRYWHEGLSAVEIAEKLKISKDTIYDLLRRLRRDFGHEIVPYHQSWREKS